MMEKIQRFGGAMYTPVLLFSFAGVAVALSVVLNNESLVGSIAAEGTLWHNIWTIIENGAWTVFNQIELLFVIGLPLGLAKKANGRAALESFVIYLTGTYFISSILEFYGANFGVDFNQAVGGESGLKLIGGIKTLDTGVLGAIVFASIAVWIHNQYFEKKLPDWLGVFQGSTFVYIIGFLIMLPVALLTCLIWPKVQLGISSTQGFLVSSGVFGVGLYAFLERVLIPTGLHHFVYTPFLYGPAVVENGIAKYWMEHLSEYANSTKPLKELFPEGGFSLNGNSKIFASIGISLSFIATAKPERRKKVMTIIIPVALTAMLIGVTEPLDFTFLFIAPPLFIVHAILTGLMAATMYIFGVVGDMNSGLIDMLTRNWLPLGANHWQTYLIQILIGLIFVGIYFVIFRFLIIKFDFETPGREKDTAEEIKLYSKKDYKAKNSKTQTDNKGQAEEDPYSKRAKIFLDAFGGAENIDKVNNCATRLRITVVNESKVAPDKEFLSGGAHGVVRKGNAFQVIVGMDVPQVREHFEQLIDEK
ncbi:MULTISPECIES: alpha-glucoside-specific PTS transporter subunit IIBC [unclassified Enterococcus]|uniref:alpha-glucoside-specific PTS transporter subunit IIBC n=1 Tax=unclassified Enterococcus TaxID=2608891 RepID=UPI0015547B2A|nr:MULTISPECIES: alpha-glucoside-specific PTS transporter subunit IIBC [unclassified Enterococcus]MBS7577826.1 alpha-glucoside-specific PTS transporter subunit IIBC [Enterococcus sp. MMGLQ5-2]MBS7585086.1 alpha-glucoside-specific PTS transporter subunit IIBC [Enterococcus sp. MMGLQ5-1]NPD12942.1 PTS transporter subunit EIIC [Enterococcus sp. MMGLQ5-1]NPD37656.1 PTS transporter subunit EIIC [Enterococcus sp. MMGLQ5-2]